MRNRNSLEHLLPVALAFCTSLGFGQEPASPPSLPEGKIGIASRHIADVGIENDPNVVFVENFNDDLDSVTARWDQAKSKQDLTLSEDDPLERDGNLSLLVTHIGGQGSGPHLYRQLPPGFDKLHYRFYVKFDEHSAPMHHFFHVGGYHPSTPWPHGGAGERPRGDERFSVGVEPFGTSWNWDYYAYWMEMRGSPPRGQSWGNKFMTGNRTGVTRGQWQCLELMIKLNDVGQSNGEMALWLDGKLVSHLGPAFPAGKWVFGKFLPGEGGNGLRWSEKLGRAEELTFPENGDPFEGFRWRSDESLNLNFLWLLCYITKSPQGTVSKIWFDNIVVAKDYIGPIQFAQ